MPEFHSASLPTIKNSSVRCRAALLVGECAGDVPLALNAPFHGAVCLSRRSETKPDGRVARLGEILFTTLDCYRSRRFFLCPERNVGYGFV